MTEYLDTNHIWLSGTVLDAPQFSHEHLGESFFRCVLEVPRLSGHTDKLPVTLPGRLLIEPLRAGQALAVQGQLRTYNRYIEGSHRLVLAVFVKRICQSDGDRCNEIQLTGTLCKTPIYRRTPLGREIADLLIAVNRGVKSDFIPCIAWGQKAREIGDCAAGCRVHISGRMQSRAYEKQLPDGRMEDRLAYEVSVIGLEIIKSEET